MHHKVCCGGLGVMESRWFFKMLFKCPLKVFVPRIVCFVTWSGAGVALLDASACSAVLVTVGLWFVWLGHHQTYATHVWVVVGWHGSASSLLSATNCKPSILFIVFPQAWSFALWVRSVSCVFYQLNGIRLFLFPYSPGSLRGVGWTIGWPRVPGTSRIFVWLPWRMGLCLFSWMRTVSCGRGVTTSIRPSYIMHLSIDTNDCRTRLGFL